jgi:hypothetical protein
MKPPTKPGNPITRAWDKASDEERGEFFKAREFEIYAVRCAGEQLQIDECRQELRRNLH